MPAAEKPIAVPKLRSRFDKHLNGKLTKMSLYIADSRQSGPGEFRQRVEVEAIGCI